MKKEIFLQIPKITKTAQTLKSFAVFYITWMTSSQYERELRKILSGEKKTILKITKTCDSLEKNNYNKIYQKPFAVVRAAGSLGVDLVAVRGDISFLTEVKSSVEQTLHFSSMSGKLQKQAESMRQVCETAQILPIYAYRLKGIRGDSWRFFTFDMKGLDGISRVIHQRIPKLEQSKKGNFVMRWQKGMPLSNFISYLCR